MMSAEDYRARAKECMEIADRAEGDPSVLEEYKAMARTWAWLAQQADWQDNFRNARRRNEADVSSV